MTDEEYLWTTQGLTQAQFVALVRQMEATGATPEEWAEARQIGDAMVARQNQLRARLQGKPALKVVGGSAA